MGRAGEKGTAPTFTLNHFIAKIEAEIASGKTNPPEERQRLGKRDYGALNSPDVKDVRTALLAVGKKADVHKEFSLTDDDEIVHLAVVPFGRLLDGVNRDDEDYETTFGLALHPPRAERDAGSGVLDPAPATTDALSAAVSTAVLLAEERGAMPLARDLRATAQKHGVVLPLVRVILFIIAGVIGISALAYALVPTFRAWVQRQVPILRPAPVPRPAGTPSGAAITVTPPSSRGMPVTRLRRDNALIGARVGPYLYVARGRQGVQVYDITVVRDPRLVRTIRTSEALAVVARDPYLFVADASAGVRVVDLRKPDADAIVATVPTAGRDSGIALQGSYLYVASGTVGLRVIDVGTPERSAVVATATDSPLSQVGSAQAIVLDGKRAYVAQQPHQTFGGGLVVFDVHDRRAPEAVGVLITPQGATALLPVGRGFVLLAEPIGLRVVDVTEQQPQSLTISEIAKNVRDLVALTPTNALALGPQESLLLDVSNPLAPVRLPNDTSISDTVLANRGIAYAFAER